jgi:hypothetical protein
VDVAGCSKHILDARFEHRRLLGAYSSWLAGGGVELVSDWNATSPEEDWYVCVRERPRPDLCVLGASVFACLQAALTSLAIRVYRAAGGGLEDRHGLSVRFPVVDNPTSWITLLRQTIPTPWPAAEALLRSVQPFAKQSSSRPVSVLRSLLESAPLQLFVDRESSELPEIPASALDIGASGRGQVIRFASLRSDSGAASDESGLGPTELVFRLPGVATSNSHPGPKAEFGFQAADGTRITLMEIKSLINEVDSILARFASLTAPDGD